MGDVALVPNAAPEVDFAELDASVTLLGHHLELPLVIASMTGGHPEGERINGLLARAAERHGLAMGLGSQRAALRDPDLARTYAVARTQAPTAPLFANVGAAQLVAQGDVPAVSIEEVGRLVEMIRADALIVHLNALQELIQPEGDRNARGWLAAIARLAAELPVPVIVKEVGGGISAEVAVRLVAAGVAAIDVGGRGGTSFASIEGRRAAERGDTRGMALAGLFETWGIPTPASIVFAARAGVPVIATGGIRSGLDAAGAIALGATGVGVARPLLEAAMAGPDAIDTWIERFREGLLAAQFLTGSTTLGDLRRVQVVLSGDSARWVAAAGAAV